MSENCVIRSYAHNLLKFRVEFSTPSKVKCRRLKLLGLFLYNFIVAAIAFPLNNNICLFVFSECFQITH